MSKQKINSQFVVRCSLSLAESVRAGQWQEDEQAHASPTAKAVKARAYREKRKVDLTSEEQAEARRKNRSVGNGPQRLHGVLGGAAVTALVCAGGLTTPACLHEAGGCMQGAGSGRRHPL